MAAILCHDVFHDVGHSNFHTLESESSSLDFRQEKLEVDRAPTPAPVHKVEAVVPSPKTEPPKPRQPVSFPELKMQGLFLNEKVPYAIINGQSYAAGDHLGDITIKAIDRAGVMLELAGELKMLMLR